MKRLKRYFIQQMDLMVHQKGFQFSIIVMFVLVMTSYLCDCISMKGVDRFRTLSWEGHCILTADNSVSLNNIFVLAFPFLGLFPFSFSLMKERQIMMKDLYLSRVNKKEYYIVKMVTCFVGSFVTMFLPLLINIVMCFVTFDGRHKTMYGEPGFMTSQYVYRLNQVPFAGIYVSHPLLYYILWAMYVSLIAAVLGVFTLAFSTFVKKYNVFLFLPSYILIELIGKLRIPQCDSSLYDYIAVGFIPDRNPLFLIVFLTFFCIVTTMSLLMEMRKEIYV